MLISLPENGMSKNDDLVKGIQQDAVGSGLLEAFLESTPQFIFQCSIIVRTGIISKQAKSKSFLSVQFENNILLI